MIRPRLAEDLPSVEALLAAAGLHAAGLDRTTGWVLTQEDRIFGHVALEPAADATVLRSLVVDPAYQAGGHGRRLLDMAEGAVRQGPIVLRTDAIAPWVLRRGYREIALGDIPPGVRITSQFEGGHFCAATPVFRKEIP